VKLLIVTAAALPKYAGPPAAVVSTTLILKF